MTEHIIAINIQFEGNVQAQQDIIIQLPPHTSWDDLQAMLKAQFDCDAIKVQYIDTEGDFIIIGSNEELKEAFRMAQQSCHSTLVLRVKDLTQETAVWTIDDTPPPIPQRCPITRIDTPPARPARPAAVTHVDTPQARPAAVTQIDAIPARSEVQVDDQIPFDIRLEGQPQMTEITDQISINSEQEGVHEDMNQSRTVVVAVPIELGSVSEATKTSEKVVKETEIDHATGEAVTVTIDNENDEKILVPETNVLSKSEATRDEETGTENPKLPQIVKRKTKRKDKMVSDFHNSRRQTQSADRSVKARRSAYDSESGETSHDDNPMPYGVFVKFMQQLKSDLRQEIVKDVTRKTVKQVLKGLDGAVIHSLQGTSGVPIVPPVLDDSAKETKDPTSSHPTYYHEGIVCDFCERSIVGVRYKCCNCANYDLCEECEAIHGVHDSDHVFLKLRKPVRLGRRTVILKNNLYRKPLSPDTTHGEEQIPSLVPQSLEDILRTKMERLQEKTARKQEKLRKREEKIVEKQKRKEEKLKRRLECHRDHPTKRERLDLPVSYKPVCKEWDASFICDVTVPDGTCVQPGTKLQKTWKMKNTGTKEWTDDTKLRLVYGSIPTPSNDVDVPKLKPDEECDVTVELQAPERPGKYQSHWKMFDSGDQFGHRVWCEITVEPKEVLEPIREDSLKCLVQTEEETTPFVPSVKEQNEHLVFETKEKTVEYKETVQEVSDFTVRESVQEPQQMGETERANEDEQVSQQEDETPAIGDKQLEKDLSTAVAQLKIDSQPESDQTGQDLMSFEMVDYAQRVTPKISQTATPTNTPLDISPPKSPVPEIEYKALSSSSSVELVNVDNEDEQQQMNPFVEEFMSKFQVPKPAEEEDIQSISTLSDDDSSLSEDDDFLIVPLPACFDFSKPITRSTTADVVSDDDNNVDDNHNNMPSAYSGSQTENQSVDEILITSGDVTTPPLNPVSSSDQQNAPADKTNEPGPTFTGEDTFSDFLGKPAPTQEEEIEVIAAPVAEVPVAMVTMGREEPETASDEAVTIDNTLENDETNGNDQEEITETKEPISYDNYANDAGASAGIMDNVIVERSDAKGATGHDHKGQKSEHSRGEFVNQIMSTAVNAANKAAANAYTTCKEVFYTWQARHYQSGSGKWKPVENKFTPQQSSWEPKAEKWTPKEDNYVPPASGWTPPKETWKPPTQNMSESVAKSPEGKLMEMGFCNRDLNRQLLKKHDNDVEAVVQELLGNLDNDWMSRRH